MSFGEKAPFGLVSPASFHKQEKMKTLLRRKKEESEGKRRKQIRNSSRLALVALGRRASHGTF